MKNLKLFLFLIIFLLSGFKLMASPNISIYDFEFTDIAIPIKNIKRIIVSI